MAALYLRLDFLLFDDLTEHFSPVFVSLEDLALFLDFVQLLREINQLSGSNDDTISAISGFDFKDSHNPIFAGECLLISL